MLVFQGTSTAKKTSGKAMQMFLLCFFPKLNSDHESTFLIFNPGILALIIG